MNPFILLPVVIGAAVVVQAGMNRQIANLWGLGGAVLLNSVVVLLLSVAVFAVIRIKPDLFPQFLHWPEQPEGFAWWRGFLPGLLGITIVLGLPWAFARLGALEVILTVMVAQVIASLVWDARIESIPAHPLRIAGALVALAGATLATWKR